MPKPQLQTILFLSLSALSAYLISLFLPFYYLAQTLAALALPLLYLISKKKFNILFFSLSSLIVNLIVFSTNGLNSPVFFLIYFLLFTLAFTNPPSTTLAYSLVLIILLSQSLNSPTSLLPLLSLLLITPLAYFIGRLTLEKQKTDRQIARHESDIFLWSSLTLKTTLASTIDSCSQILSTPLNASQTNLIKKIKTQSQKLLSSGQNLAKKIDKLTDE